MSKYEFQAEINQLLSLIINAFYSNKDIYLRELLSNASDALDKQRYLSIKEGINTTNDLEIKVHVDKDNKKMFIEDNGIGMNKDDLISCLGTIANSGTKQFMESLKEGKADVSLIGQFGVGFYSSFLVAEKVKVYSRKSDESCYVWESNAGGTFVIDEAPEDVSKAITRGTRIELTMKEECLTYLEESKIKSIVKDHCQYLTFPINLLVVRKETKEETDDEEDPDDNKESEEDDTQDTKEEKDEDPDDDEESKEDTEPKEKPKKTKSVEYEIEEWKQLNKEKPIWLRKPDEVTKEEYAQFFKSLTNSWDDHLAVKHFSAEGQIEFKAMLYLPKQQSQDMFSSSTKKKNIKLYVKRIFIMDNCEDLLPDWLSCISGLIDSEDLPLNVSREMLQQNNIMKIIKKNIIKKSIELFTDLSEDDSEEGVKTFGTFYENFNKNIKLGIHEDTANRKKLVKLLRFYTHKSPDKLVSLTEYVSNMAENQKNIYFITGQSVKSLKNSPFVKAVASKGFDILFMVDAIDEYIVQSLTDFEEHKLVNISKEKAEIEGTEEINEEDKEKHETLCKRVKEILGNQVENVTMSKCIDAKNPCYVTSSAYGWSANMERIIKAQTLQTNNVTQQAQYMSKKNFELNPNHNMIINLCKYDSATEKSFIKSIELMYQTALLASGYSHEDPSTYTDKVFQLIGIGLNVDEEEDVEEETNDEIEKEAIVEEEGYMEEVD